MKSIFGANWPTTLWGGLFTFALFLALNPNALDGLIPTDWARVLVRWAVLITGFVAFYRTKDKTSPATAPSTIPLAKPVRTAAAKSSSDQSAR
jgi:hypothetical protein